MSADFNAGSIQGSLDLDLTPFRAGLRMARGEAIAFERESHTAKVSLDDKEFTAKKDVATAELDKFGHKKETAKVNVDTGEAMAKMAVLNRVMDAGGMGKKLTPGLMGGAKFAGLAGGILSLAAAAGPTAAVMGGLGAAVTAATAAAGIGFGIFSKVATSDLAKVQAATKKGLSLKGPAGEAQQAIKGVDDTWEKLQKRTQTPVFGVLTAGARLLQSIIPRIAPLIDTIGRGLQTDISYVQGLVKSPIFGTFLHQITRFMGDFTKTLGPVLTNGLAGAMSLFGQLMPMFHVLGADITHISFMFDSWAEGGGLHKFISYAIKEMPLVMSMIGHAFALIGNLVSGLAPLANPAMKFFNTLVDAVFHLNIAPFAAGFGQVLNVLRPILPLLITLVNIALKPIGQLLATLAHGPLRDITRSLGSELAPAFGSLKTILGALVGPLAAFIGSIANLVNPTGIKLAATLLHVLAGVVTALAGPMSAMAVVLESVIDTALDAMVPILKAVAPLFVSLAHIIGGALLQAAKALAPVFGTVIRTLMPALKQVIVALMPVIKQLAEAIFPALVKIIKALVPVIGPLAQILAELITKVIIPLVIPVIKEQATVFAHLITVLADVITWVAKALTWFLKFAQGPQMAQKAIKNAWDWIKQQTDNFGNWLYNKLLDIRNWAINLGQWFKQTFTQMWHDAWNAIVQQMGRWGQDIDNGFRQLITWATNLGQWVKQTFVGFFNDAWSAIKRGWTGLKDDLKAIYDTGIKPIWDAVKTGLGDLKGYFRDAVDGIQRTWKGIQSAAEVPIKFVVNTVLDNGIIPAINKIGGIFPGFKKVQPFRTPFARGSWVPGHATSDHSDNVPSDLTPQEFVFKRRSAMGIAKMFPGLLEAMNEHGPAALMRAHFAGGGWVDKLLESTTPVGLMKSSVEALINRIPGGGSSLSSAGRSVSNGLLNKAENFITSKLTGLSPLGMAVGAIGKLVGPLPGGSGVGRWAPDILKVLSMLHQPASLLGTVERRMMRESGGNPTIVNHWDSNAAAGHPSQGLMQVIPGTFAAYAGPLRGLGILNPLANIYAGLNYSIHEYGSIARAMNQPGGYLLGGTARRTGLAALSENGLPEIVAGPQYQRLKAGSRVYNAAETARLLASAGGSMSEAKLDALINLIAKLLDKTPTAADIGQSARLSHADLKLLAQMQRAM